jgi:hypothetical protein
MAKRQARSASVPLARRTCGCMQVNFRLFEESPDFRKNQVDLEHACKARLRMAVAARTGPYKVKVVVHVIHNTATEKISNAQVKSQIAVLNKDFRAKNPDRSKAPTIWKGLVADSMIEYELATKDPNGKPTTGITYTQTSRTSFSDDDGVKSSTSGGANPWNTDKYANIWVCTLGSGLLGYAQFPGGPKKTDGVVILNTAFGTSGSASVPFDLGRTTVHEMGHFFNLRHIWGDTPDCSGGDFVDDTPNSETPNTGKPNFPSISCSNGPNGDMYMNYMDYVDDDSMFMFTPGQVARMHATLEGPRKSLVT